MIGDFNIVFSGPSLPFKLAGSAMITSPSGKGVVLIGGYNDGTQKYSKAILEFRSSTMEWFIMKAKLRYARADHVVIPVPVVFDPMKNSRQSCRKRKARMLYQAGFS